MALVDVDSPALLGHHQVHVADGPKRPLALLVDVALLSLLVPDELVGQSKATTNEPRNA